MHLSKDALLAHSAVRALVHPHDCERPRWLRRVSGHPACLLALTQAPARCPSPTRLEATGAALLRVPQHCPQTPPVRQGSSRQRCPRVPSPAPCLALAAMTSSNKAVAAVNVGWLADGERERSAAPLKLLCRRPTAGAPQELPQENQPRAATLPHGPLHRASEEPSRKPECRSPARPGVATARPTYAFGELREPASL